MITSKAKSWDEETSVVNPELPAASATQTIGTWVNHFTFLIFFVPLGGADWLKKKGFTVIQEKDWWEVTDVGPAKFIFLPAQHWSPVGRGPWIKKIAPEKFPTPQFGESFVF